MTEAIILGEKRNINLTGNSNPLLFYLQHFPHSVNLFYFMHVSVLPACMCVPMMAEEAGRGCRIPWNWSSGWL